MNASSTLLRRFGWVAIAIAASGALSAEPRDDAKAAIKALSEKSSYSWTSTVDTGNAGFPMGPTVGRTERDGATWISQEINNQKLQAIRKGEKSVVQVGDQWQALSELPEGGPGGGGAPDPARMAARMGRRLATTKLPTEDLVLAVEKCKDLKASDGVIQGDLSEEGAKEFLRMGRGRRGGGTGGGEADGPKNAKGSVKIWAKDGLVTKSELKVSGLVRGFNGDEVDMTRTTTTEFKDVGTTKIEIPADAAKKL